MKKIIYILFLFVMVAFSACTHKNPNIQYVQCETVGDTVYKTKYCQIHVVVIDSCEYLMGERYGSSTSAGFMSHKGNCKYCEERRRQQNKRNY